MTRKQIFRIAIPTGILTLALGALAVLYIPAVKDYVERFDDGGPTPASPGSDHIAAGVVRFEKNYRFNDGTGQQKLTSIVREIKWRTFKQLVEDVDLEGNDDLGLHFYYGLTGIAFQLAVEVVGLKKIDPKSATYSDRFKDDLDRYRLYEERALSTPIFKEIKTDGSLGTTTLATWRTAAGARYMNTMEFRRLDDAARWEHPVKDLDPIGETFPWRSELRRLVEENDIEDDDKLVIQSIASCAGDLVPPDGNYYKGVDYAHALCLYVKDKINAESGDPRGKISFKGQGANLGTLCPPRCGFYVLSPDLD